MASLFLIGFGNQAFAQYDDKLAILETNLGIITIEFFPNDAPNHVENFIKLTESGFYNETIFHRIIPGFMIQGGDPNTISGDPNTWGTGNSTEMIDAEFNTIKHNHGIVSMARAADPNSASSQFFIVHKNSNFLDEQYTVFGRITTDESFETLDKIAEVQTGQNDRPLKTDQVKITNTSIINRSELSNILELSEPERTQSDHVEQSIGSQIYESTLYNVKFSVPEGWLLQQPERTNEDAPNILATGPKLGKINPVISLTIKDTKGKTFDELITIKNENLQPSIEEGNLVIVSQEKKSVDNYMTYTTTAIGFFETKTSEINVKFQDVLIYTNDKSYTLSYTNDLYYFLTQLDAFEETLENFEIIKEDEIIESESGGGCLIATATYGSEMALEVQQLRELRDNSLLQTKSGTSFMSTFNDVYYSFSPYIADRERENPIFKEAVKLAITPMISSLSLLNYVDMNSESEVLGYGISLIILNLGMYLGVPAVVIVGIKKRN